MAYITQVSTSTLSNQNISSALLVHTYTNTTRIRKLWVNVFIDQVAGNGDYKASITVQRAGAGSAYQSIVTTNTLASGVTSGYFGSIVVTLNATDVMKVYITGLAGDTTTPDIITDVNEEWESIDTSGRVDLGAWLGSAPAALTANGYLQSTLLRWLTDNAAGTPLALSTNKVQAETSAVSVTVTQIANALPVVTVGSDWDFYTASSFTATLTSCGNISARTKLWFALKTNDTDTDAQSLLFIEESAGLTVVNGTPYSTTANGSLVVTTPTDATIALTIKPAVTSLLTAATGLYYELAFGVVSTGAKTIIQRGRANIVNGVVKTLP